MRTARSHTVWLAANGPGPWPCTFCGDPVLRLGDPRIERAAAGIIHHDDHDHGNNAIGNLRAAHNGCHVCYHNSPRGEMGHFYVVDTLTARIEAGDLERGSKLPSEKAVAKDFGVAYGTVRRAMDVLRERGLIVTIWGKGTFVREEQP
jgi:GntR family transcriptional regulator